MKELIAIWMSIFILNGYISLVEPDDHPGIYFAKQLRKCSMIKNRKIIPATFSFDDCDRLNAVVKKKGVHRTKYIEKAVMAKVKRDEKK